jgi:hypothetical protein
MGSRLLVPALCRAILPAFLCAGSMVSSPTRVDGVAPEDDRAWAPGSGARSADDSDPPGVAVAEGPAPESPAPKRGSPLRSTRAARGLAGASARARPDGDRAAEARSTATAPEALFIPLDRVLQLGADRLRAVRWTGALDPSGRPRGVRLSGVAPLSLGLVDGDVVTSIDGSPTATQDEATAAGLAAWSRGEHRVHATIVRGEHLIPVTMDLPAGPR